MSRSTRGPARRSAPASCQAYHVLLSSPTGCPSSMELRSLKNLDSPSRTGTLVVSRAAQPTATRGSGSEHAVVACADVDNDTRFLAFLLSTMNLGRLSAQAAQPGLSVKVL